MAIATIEDVITALEKIIDESIETSSPLGYFAALYHMVTVQVKEGADKQQFVNNGMMKQFDVVFASRYLDAMEAWKNKQPLTGSWKIAFEAAEKSSYLVLQHLLLGMNAHINFDLGIAAAEIAGAGPMDAVRKDFDSINDLLAALTYPVLNGLSRVSPLLSLLGMHSGNSSSILIQFSIANARDGAWVFAEDLHAKQGADRDACMAKRDKTIATLAGGLIHMPSFFMRLTVWVIRLFEKKNVTDNIRALQEYKKTYITINKD
ncbi:DUF5995 family protein [Danxiaibacter flavus]|uniref:DUF5995 family protein n=1 Tax=Danxiaibacter flavus TaxID=3049108 RepID=A0ABV3ZLB2_9BACT|nr:DUF5995 family protein [Chitinophagaceae bacterium DXS]